MLLTLIQRLGGPAQPAQEDEVWRVRVGREAGEVPEVPDFVPAAVLAPELGPGQLYEFEEFRLRAQRLEESWARGEAESSDWTALPVKVRHARGEMDEMVAIRTREAAGMAVRSFVDFARDVFPGVSELWVRVE